jgi:hypothetical protein
MSVNEAIMFIHPLDFVRMLNHRDGPIDIIFRKLHGLQVNEVNGVIYYQTVEVPETLQDAEPANCWPYKF